MQQIKLIYIVILRLTYQVTDGTI